MGSQRERESFIRERESENENGFPERESESFITERESENENGFPERESENFIRKERELYKKMRTRV